MQSENSEHIYQRASDTTHTSNATNIQHGLQRDVPTATPLLSHLEQHGNTPQSGSEWSYSTSPGPSPSESHDTWLESNGAASPSELDIEEEHIGSTEQKDEPKPSARKPSKGRSNYSPLQNFPEEMLFHVISHLSADDLLTVKLVSRRFYDLVNSPHAWINAFSRYFPGPDSLSRSADHSANDNAGFDLRSERRSFTRLQPTASWTGEYLLRTKLLRCLARGKPSLPFAAPSPGKPNKGFATFTYGSRLKFGVTHLHAKFGPVLDKRLPQFVHGLSENGTVTSSDRRGKFDGWGLIDRIMFQDFAAIYPGTPQWGLGSGEVVGIPNIMDLSSSHGMVYGEGTPGGQVYYLANGEKHGRYLASFLNVARHEAGMPKISPDFHSICSVWIAKSTAVPRMTKGVIGLLSGSSCGVLSAYSVGVLGDRLQRFERGELTARWVLSPGVPIVGISVDEHYSEKRSEQHRIWAMVVNALGEVFALTEIPQVISQSTIDPAMDPELVREVRAWELGRSVAWNILKPSLRTEKFSRSDAESSPSYFCDAVSNLDSIDQTPMKLREIETWLTKRPLDIRAEFENWDMRRRVEVDFAGDDGKGAGEAAFVIECGLEESRAATILKYTRCFVYHNSSQLSAVNAIVKAAEEEDAKSNDSIFSAPSWSFPPAQDDHPHRQGAGGTEKSTKPDADASESSYEWRCSRLIFGRHKNIKVSTTAIDCSNYALTTCADDVVLRRARGNDHSSSSKTESPAAVDEASPLKMPGQRARFIAVGTSNGVIFLWNARTAPSSASGVVNDIKPLRIIFTDSPEITSLALTALYLVHGGSEGLVQAWDPLASTLQPVRTISSRNTLNARRRAVIAAQQNPTLQVQMLTSSYAATAICLDPDPSVLRGIVAIGSHLRYWAFSSTAATDDMSKSQKRKMNRVARGLDSNSGDNFLGTRRLSLKGFVNQEVAERAMEEKERRAEQREERRLAGRFGMNLLGNDASEEELLAYAKLLSEEDHEKHSMQAMEGRLSKNATDAEIEAFMNTLTEDDQERWRFASWEERFGMPISNASTITRGPPIQTPAEGDDDVDEDLAKALRLSLEETQPVPPPTNLLSPGSSSARSAQSWRPSSTMDDDMAEAIRLSLVPSGQAHSPPSSEVPIEVTPPFLDAEPEGEDDLAKAIRLSLQDQKQSSYNRNVVRASEEDAFPPLGSPSSGTGSPLPSGKGRKGKGKGKGPAYWE